MTPESLLAFDREHLWHPHAPLLAAAQAL